MMIGVGSLVTLNDVSSSPGAGDKGDVYLD